MILFGFFHKTLQKHINAFPSINLQTTFIVNIVISLYTIENKPDQDKYKKTNIIDITYQIS